VSSINQIHTAAGLPAPGRSEVVRRALSGVRRIRRTPPKRRSPLLLADVRTILTAMSPSLRVWPDAMAVHRDAALLLMGFAGAHRRSELVALHLDDVTVHPTDGLHIRMVSSKTDQEARGAVRALPFGRDPATCPPCALIRWRRLLLAFDQGGRRTAMNQLHRRGLTAEHCCRTVEDSKVNAEPAGGGAAAARRRPLCLGASFLARFRLPCAQVRWHQVRDTPALSSSELRQCHQLDTGAKLVPSGACHRLTAVRTATPSPRNAPTSPYFGSFACSTPESLHH